jgi:DNA-binding HxlR family transcriptional regulator
VYGQVPPKVEYSLTKYGRTLRRLLNELCAWGSKHEQRTAFKTAPRSIATAALPMSMSRS